MKLDFGKMLKVATIPIVILIVVSLIKTFIGFVATIFPPVGFALCALIPLTTLISIVVLAWAGFKAVKEAQMDIIGGALTGGLTSFVAGVVGGMIGLVINMAGIGVGLAGSNSIGSAAIGVGMNAVGGVFNLIISVVTWTVFGLVLGAVGAFVAQNMKK